MGTGVRRERVAGCCWWCVMHSTPHDLKATASPQWCSTRPLKTLQSSPCTCRQNFATAWAALATLTALVRSISMASAGSTYSHTACMVAMRAKRQLCERVWRCCQSRCVTLMSNREASRAK